MNTLRRWTIMAAMAAVCTSAAALAAPAGETGKTDAEAKQPETTVVPYLGVGVFPVDTVLGAELDLPEGVGLNVNHVDSESGASHRIHFGDVLHKLDDQILVNPQQFRVLVRAYEPGDEVRVRLFRGGVPLDVQLVVGSREVPVHAAGAAAANTVRLQAMPGGDGQRVVGGITLGANAGGAGGTRTVFRFGGQNAGTSTVTRTENDKTFSLQTTTTESKKLTVTDKDGNVVFDGPVSTPEDRKAVPDDLKPMLDKLDAPAAGGMGTVIQIQTQGQP